MMVPSVRYGEEPIPVPGAQDLKWVHTRQGINRTKGSRQGQAQAKLTRQLSSLCVEKAHGQMGVWADKPWASVPSHPSHLGSPN
jgi:hypothetical protein